MWMFLALLDTCLETAVFAFSAPADRERAYLPFGATVGKRGLRKSGGRKRQEDAAGSE